MSAVSNETRLSQGHKSEFMQAKNSMFKEVSELNLERANEIKKEFYL